MLQDITMTIYINSLTDQLTLHINIQGICITWWYKQIVIDHNNSIFNSRLAK